MKLITFTGRKHAGKSTAARELLKLVEYPKILSFAAPIKRATMAMGFTNAEVYSDDKEALIAPFNVSMRRVFQTLGTDWGRNMINKDMWLLLFERAYRTEERSGTQLVVVDDIRFDNEADMVRSLGGVIILVQGKPIQSDDDHPSECSIAPHFIDYTLNQQPNLQDFLVDVRNLGYHILNGEKK